MDQKYKESPEGREVQRLYGDILPLSRPESSRSRMDLVQRAKIFTPYDALRGFDEAIDAVSETVLEISRIDLSEERKQELSDQFARLHKGMQAAAAFFVPRSSQDQGFYTAVGGTIRQVDPVNRTLSLQESLRYTLPDPEAAPSCLDEILRTMQQTDLTDHHSDTAGSSGISSHSASSVPSGSSARNPSGFGTSQPSRSHQITKNLPTTIHFSDVLEIRFEPA